MGQNTKNSTRFFCMISTTLIKIDGGGGLPDFIVELTITFIGTLKHKLQATVPVLC